MNTKNNFLAYIAYQLRVDSLRSTTAAGSGHPTSCLSAADIISVLFFYTMKQNDYFILSKGHAAPILYAVYKQLGKITDTELLNLRTFNSCLEGHPTPRFSYTQATTGSLGQGLAISLGITLAERLQNISGYTYVLMGDSEITEGSVWEAAELAAFYKTKNLIGIIDVNHLGQSAQTIEAYDTSKYAQKFTAFGWQTITVNGHSIAELCNAFDTAHKNTQPTIIIAKTIKGYGISNIENREGFHGKTISQEALPKILTELAQRFPEAAQYTAPPFKNTYNPEPRTKKSHMEILLPTPTYKIGEAIATRLAFGQALTQAGRTNKNIICLDAEVKNSTYTELFEEEFPARFFQCFIAEQNMVSMAVGFSASDNIPFISTFSAFLTRAHDQIRMAAIGSAPLRIIGSHAGVSIGADGPSQMGLEDIALFRTLPNSIVLYPCDAISTYKLVACMANYHAGISYLRTTRNTTPVLYAQAEEFKIGGCKILKKTNRDVACIITAGITVFEALKAHAILEKNNIAVSIIDCYSIKPLDIATITATVIASGKRVVTVEDHYQAGGLGEATVYALRNNNCTFTCLAVTKLPRSGTTEQLLQFEEIDASAIVQNILNLIQ